MIRQPNSIKKLWNMYVMELYTTMTEQAATWLNVINVLLREKNQDVREYIQYDSIYPKVKNRQKSGIYMYKQ